MKLCGVVFLFLIISQCFGWNSALKYTGQCPVSTVKNNRVTRISNSVTDINLASCGIEVINEYSFKYWQNLKDIRLEKNNIKDLVVGTFQNNLQLKYINLGCNEIGELKSGIFWKLASVTELLLDRNRIALIEENVFSDMSALERLIVNSNKINILNENLFSNNKHLLELNLADNKLENLNKNVFKNVNQLKELYLQCNRIVNIKKEHFSNLIYLEELNLSFNNIQDIELGSFNNTKSLRKLWLNDNQISSLHDKLFINLILLKYLHINNNLIMHMGTNTFPSTAKFIEVYIDQNKLRRLDTTIINQLQIVTELSLHNNPWTCDCTLKELYKMWKNHTEYSKPQCAEPVNLQNVFWDNLSMTDFCPILLLTDNKRTLNAVVGNNVFFTCNATQQVHWLYRNNTIHGDSVSASGQRYNILSEILNNTVTSTLTIAQVQIEDGGIYTCQTVSSGELQEKDIVLSLIIPHARTMWQILGSVLLTLLILMAIIMAVVVKKYIFPKASKSETALSDINTSYPLYDEIKMSSDKINTDQDEYMIPKCINFKVNM